MKTKLLVGGLFSLVLLVGFQNCGQPGSVELVNDVNGPAQKLNSDSIGQQDPPLVIDVVDAINDNSDGVAAPADPIIVLDEVKIPTKELMPSEEPAPSQELPVAQPAPEAGSTPAPVVSVPIINNVEEVLADNSCGRGGKKVLVCHIPPGNPAAKHTICISRQALDAHKNHGHSAVEHQDYVGACLN